jgi:hypothetical protein
MWSVRYLINIGRGCDNSADDARAGGLALLTDTADVDKHSPDR